MQKLVCIDPQMHSYESHAEIHHPGLLPGADFCDAGIEDAPSIVIGTPDQEWDMPPLEEIVDSLEVQEKPLLGRLYRAVMGGEAPGEHVDVSAHEHHGHSSSVKVRPAAGLPLHAAMPHQGHPNDSKVSTSARPRNFGYPQETHLSITPKKPDEPVTESLPGHAGGPPPTAHEGHIRISKVQQATVDDPPKQTPPVHDVHDDHVRVTKIQPVHSPAPVAKHEGHSTMPKVQPYNDERPSLKTEMTFDSTKTEWGVESGEEPRGTLAQIQRLLLDEYWGFRGEPRETPRIPEASEEEQCETDEVIYDSADDHCSGEDKKVALPPHNSQPSQPSLSVDFMKTAQWLRDLLRYPDAQGAKLTEMPDKSKLRAKAKDNSVHLFEAESEGPAVSRALTRQSTAASNIDKEFKKAVRNLEHLLNEALELANEAVDRENRQDDHTREDTPQPSERVKQGPEHRFLGDGDDNIYGTEEESIYQQPPTGYSEMGSEDAKSTTYNVHSGIHGRQVRPGVPRDHVAVPERLSSLPRNKVYTSGDLLIITQFDSYDDARCSIRLSSRPRANPGDGAADIEISQPQPEDLHNKLAVQDFIDAFDYVQAPVQPVQSVQLVQPARLRDSQAGGDDEAGFDESVQDEDIVDGAAIPQHSSKPCVRRSRSSEVRAPPQVYNRGATAAAWSLDGVADDDIIDWTTQYSPVGEASSSTRGASMDRQRVEGHGINLHDINLHNRSHVSLRGHQTFSMAGSYARQPVARDWSVGRKRFVASVACVNTALIGILIGIYAGLVPSIQYYIVDLHHYVIIGNVVFYFGLAIPTFFCWPLPLLHGRKPYILLGMAVALPLLFPQAVAVSDFRSPYTSEWRWALLLPRALMGLALGFASMNFHSMLTDVFGASLMSGNPHQEVVDKYDVRRHGGGMGVWLGIWTWCFVGSLGVGFLIGACIINSLNPSWGFYVSIILIAIVLLLNVVCPEVRRSPYRRSVAEVRRGNQVSRRVARGEVMMHRIQDGPTWWGQEMYHGVLLSLEMLRQPGFAIMALYTGWTYAQVVLIIVLLGSLTSKSYKLQSPWVGFCVSFISIGALIAVPFQKANIFSRFRHHQPLSSENTLKDSQITWTSHFLRRAIFSTMLPLVGIAYTFVSPGPPMPVAVPTVFASLIGTLSGLAIAECNGLIMETFDTSDLQPGMTGRPRGSEERTRKRTNYSSFPRITSGLAICHTLGFIFAAGATGIGGIAQRSLGQREATGVVAGILFVLTLLLLAALVRFRRVQIIPTSRTMEMERWTEVRRENIRRRSMASRIRQPPPPLADEEIFRPIIIGNPSNKTRRVNMLELGALTRWTEIRRRNRLIDAGADPAHLNRAGFEEAAAALEEATGWHVTHTHSPGHMARHHLQTESPSGLSGRSYHGQSSAAAARGRSAEASEAEADGGGRDERDGLDGPTSETTRGGPDEGPDPDLEPREEYQQGSREGPIRYLVDQHGQQITRRDTGRLPDRLPDHGRTRGAGEGFSERECVMGQTVPEDTEGEVGAGADTDAEATDASGVDGGASGVDPRQWGLFRRRRRG